MKRPLSERTHFILGAAISLLLIEGLLAVRLLPIPVAAVSLPFLYLILRKPVLRRLAIRNATRRPRETVLVLLGSLLGTAIITGSFVVGDTLDASMRAGAYTKLGPIDELVVASGPDAGAEVRALIEPVARESADIDGFLPLTTLGVSVAGAGEGADRKAKPTATLVEVDFADARAFGDDPDATGISGPTPGPDEAVIGEDVADALDAGPGDTVEIFAYGQSRRLQVARVLPQVGIAGYSTSFGSDSFTLFVAPGTVQSMRSVPGAVAAAPASAVIAISNTGGIIGGNDRTEVVRKQLEKALGTTPGSVLTVKRQLLEVAEEVGNEFTQLFFAIGFFSVIAGILLLVNIFVMLAEERKSELGMLRAVGLRRAALIGTFSTEGWLYALASSALGTVAGIGVGRVIVIVASDIFGAAGDFSLDLQFTAGRSSIQTGFTIGVLISLVTVLLTSVFISRMNVIRAIRDLPEPTRDARRLSSLVIGTVAVVLGAVVTALGVRNSNASSVLVGPTMIGLGLIPLLSRFLPRRPTVSVAAAAVLVWAVAAFDVFPAAFEEADIVIFVVQGVILTISAVVLVTMNQTSIGAVVRRVGGGAKAMSLRLGLAYPLARRFRTGMTIAMYSLVMFTLTFITVFSHLFEGQIEDFTREVSGGFDLQIQSNRSNPAPVGELRARPDLANVAVLSVVGTSEWLAPGNRAFQSWPTTGFDRAFLTGDVPKLKERGPYPDDRAAYEAVLADSKKVIVSDFFLQGGGGPPELVLHPGEKLKVRDALSNRTEELEIAGIASGSFGNDRALVSLPLMRAVFGEQATPNLALATVKDGVDTEDVAASINGQFLANGADAKSFRSIVSENLSGQTQFFRLMQGYLALGLIVGIAGLGVVMIRAVRERRRQIGVLRSLGFEAAAVRRAFLVESGFVALEGILIGVVLAIITAWRLLTNDTFGGDLEFSVPVVSLLVLVLTTLALSLLATAAPAQQASRIRPAVALRIAD